MDSKNVNQARLASNGVDVKTLASLARLEVSDAELKKLEKDISAILGFVETIQKADVGEPRRAPVLQNVMREDGEPHESGIHTKELLDAAPAHKKGYVAVKQVLSRARKKK